MKTMTQLMKTRMAQPEESETEDDMFLKMIASERKKFLENPKFCRKHDMVWHGSPPAVASPNSDSGQRLRSPLMEFSSGK